MATTTSIEDLSRKIEHLVQEHLAASRAAAAAAVERAFRGTAQASSKAPRSRGTTTAGKRRAPQELEELSERFYEAVCANPGESMATLSACVGASPRELNRPMMALRRAGRIRSVGQRQATRYFPTTKGAKT